MESSGIAKGFHRNPKGIPRDPWGIHEGINRQFMKGSLEIEIPTRDPLAQGTIGTSRDSKQGIDKDSKKALIGTLEHCRDPYL